MQIDRLPSGSQQFSVAGCRLISFRSTFILPEVNYSPKHDSGNSALALRGENKR